MRYLHRRVMNHMELSAREVIENFGVTPRRSEQRLAFRRRDHKAEILARVLEPFMGKPTRILDLGIGTGKDFQEILELCPEFELTGVEFNEASIAAAERLFAKRRGFRIVRGFGEHLTEEHFGAYDLVLSLSVLEHVKNLEPFLRAGIRAAKPGATILHCYDHGHALHPASFGERAHTLCCRFAPFLVPAARFATYIPAPVVTAMLTRCGAKIESVYQCQIPDAKQLMNRMDWESPGACDAAAALHRAEKLLYDQMVAVLPADELDRYFPRVVIVARKVV